MKDETSIMKVQEKISGRLEVIHSSRNYSANTHSGSAEKNITQTGHARGKEAPKISTYATCLSPFFQNDCKKARRPRTIATVFLCHLSSSVDIRTCYRKCCSCFVEQISSQRALNVSMSQLRSPCTSNVYFLVCTGNKAAHLMWLHRNSQYNIAALETTALNCGAQRLAPCSENSKELSLVSCELIGLICICSLAVSVLVHKSKFKRKVREISKPIIQPTVVILIDCRRVQRLVHVK